MKLTFTLRQIRLNSQGYDRRGRYYGVGTPLYEYQAEYESNQIQHRPHCRFANDDTVSVQVFCQECGEIPRREWKSLDGELRAESRNAAKEQVKRLYPLVDVRFYR